LNEAKPRRRGAPRRAKKWILAALLLLVTGFQQPGEADESADTVARVARAWEQRAAAVRTVRLAWKDVYTVPAGAYSGLPAKKTTYYDNSFQFTASGDDWRVEGQRSNATSCRMYFLASGRETNSGS
jgi:hypothetical protein